MGCLNVDDKWFDDPRRDTLVESIGQTAADGTAIKMWRLAETWYRKDSIVPREIFFIHKHALAFLDAQLAEEKPEGIYIKGSKEFFQYIKEAKEGRKVGGAQRAEKAQRDENGRFLPSHLESESSSTPAAASCHQLDPASFSSSSSLALKNKELKGDAVAPPSGNLPAVSKKPRPAKNENAQAEREFIGTYVRAYGRRYGEKARPECLQDNKIIGQIRNFLTNRSLARACDLIQVYLQMDDPWFVKHGHDFITFTQKINQIGLALHNGRDPARPKSFLEYMAEREARSNEPTRIQRTD
jgi:hypothetical protein